MLVLVVGLVLVLDLNSFIVNILIFYEFGMGVMCFKRV